MVIRAGRVPDDFESIDLRALSGKKMDKGNKGAGAE
jgi:hypothetical protein